MTGYRTGCHHRRAGQVDLGLRLAHAPLEVAVGGGERRLAVADGIAAQEFVVPRSMPMILPIVVSGS